MNGIEQIFVISEDGDTITSIHSDKLPDFGVLNDAPRASEVEFMPGIGWTIKLSQHANNGIYKGKYVKNDSEVSDTPVGFLVREQALKLEVAFLNNKVLSR